MKITNLEITFDIFDEDERIGYVTLNRNGNEFTINYGTTITTEDLSKLNSFTNEAMGYYNVLQQSAKGENRT